MAAATNRYTIGSSTNRALREAAMQQQNSGNIPRVVVVVGDGGIDSILVTSDAPIKFVLVSEQTGEVEASADMAKADDLDSTYAMGEDEDEHPVVLVGPYGPDALGDLATLEHFWRQAPMFFDGSDPQVQVPASEPISEQISERISEENVDPKSTQKSEGRATLADAIEKVSGELIAVAARDSDDATVVLAKVPGYEPYVTWFWGENGGLCWGHYYRHEDNARKDFDRRVREVQA